MFGKKSSKIAEEKVDKDADYCFPQTVMEGMNLIDELVSNVFDIGEVHDAIKLAIAGNVNEAKVSFFPSIDDGIIWRDLVRYLKKRKIVLSCEDIVKMSKEDFLENEALLILSVQEDINTEFNVESAFIKNALDHYFSGKKYYYELFLDTGGILYYHINLKIKW